eukprot:6214888-Prymnesium_polylepis.1
MASACARRSEAHGQAPACCICHLGLGLVGFSLCGIELLSQRLLLHRERQDGDAGDRQHA